MVDDQPGESGSSDLEDEVVVRKKCIKCEIVLTLIQYVEATNDRDILGLS